MRASDMYVNLSHAWFKMADYFHAHRISSTHHHAAAATNIQQSNLATDSSHQETHEEQASSKVALPDNNTGETPVQLRSRGLWAKARDTIWRDMLRTPPEKTLQLDLGEPDAATLRVRFHTHIYNIYNP